MPSEVCSNKLHFIHLDDHKIFTIPIGKLILENFPNSIVEIFNDNEGAISYINNCHYTKRRIDLIITDYNHIGENGLDFAIEVRKLEKIYETRLPIVLLTMRWDVKELFQATEDGIFDAYLSKAIDSDELIACIRGIICKKVCR